MPRGLILQHDDDVPEALLGDWLREHGVGYEVVRVDRGEPLPPVVRQDLAIGMPEECAPLVVFLASDAAA
ncbi:MAG TPA: hypothetical protein VFV85_09615, partial [Conexibacter sp.]|nr:hypothetical protein [Conexibacter sp.]